jgi:hypothetical protein
MKKLRVLIAFTLLGFTSVGASSSVHAQKMVECSSTYYLNAYGNCVKRPTSSPRVPAGATAQCRDGTYSFSQSRRGTCSYHGGVRRWL